MEKQLEALPIGADRENDLYKDDEIIRNLQEQLQLANQVSGITILKLYAVLTELLKIC